jgi:hypothetical protein
MIKLTIKIDAFFINNGIRKTISIYLSEALIFLVFFLFKVKNLYLTR